MFDATIIRNQDPPAAGDIDSDDEEQEEAPHDSYVCETDACNPRL